MRKLPDLNSGAEFMDIAYGGNHKSFKIIHTPSVTRITFRNRLANTGEISQAKLESAHMIFFSDKPKTCHTGNIVIV